MEESKIEEILQIDSSKRIIEFAALKVGNNQRLFDEVMEFAFLDKQQVSMRAARVAEACCEKYPELVYKHLIKIIENLPKLKTDGVLRSFLKILIDNKIPNDDKLISILIKICDFWINDGKTAVAIKVYAMDIFYKITNIYPDLKNELILIIENQIEHNSAGFKSRGRKLLNILYKETYNI